MDLNDLFDMGFEEIETNHGHQRNSNITSLFLSPVCYRIGECPQVDGESRQEWMPADARVTELTLDFLNNLKGSQGKPWALYIGHLQPHPPFKALPEYFELYYPNRVDMANIPPGHLENLHPVFQKLRQFKRVTTPIPEERIRRARAAYFGMISELDEYIGQLWKTLEKQNLLQSTIFIYTSDHCEMLGEHGLWYKNNLLESSVRVPLVVAGPGIPRGINIDTLVSHVDLGATLLEWTNIENTPELRGHYLTGLMQKEVESHPGYVYSETHSEGNCTGSFMIR
jgi:choline-sulfatase